MVQEAEKYKAEDEEHKKKVEACLCPRSGRGGGPRARPSFEAHRADARER